MFALSSLSGYRNVCKVYLYNAQTRNGTVVTLEFPKFRIEYTIYIHVSYFLSGGDGEKWFARPGVVLISFLPLSVTGTGTALWRR